LCLARQRHRLLGPLLGHPLSVALTGAGPDRLGLEITAVRVLTVRCAHPRAAAGIGRLAGD
jgi:hypothetical protein